MSQNSQNNNNRPVKKQGRTPARYKMRCYFVDGNKFDYRGDDQRKRLMGRRNIFIKTELEALVMIFNEIRERVKTAVIYDNNLPADQSLLFKYKDGVVHINNL